MVVFLAKSKMQLMRIELQGLRASGEKRSVLFREKHRSYIIPPRVGRKTAGFGCVCLLLALLLLLLFLFYCRDKVAYVE